MIKKLPMWAWEQLVLTSLVAVAVRAQLYLLAERGAVRAADVVVLVASAALTIAAQKTRSMGDRQSEQNKLGGIQNAHMSCAGRVAFWGFVTQILGTTVSIAAAPTWSHIAVALFVGGYGPVWRRFYRWRRPAKAEHRPRPLELVGSVRANQVTVIHGDNHEPIVLKR